MPLASCKPKYTAEITATQSSTYLEDTASMYMTINGLTGTSRSVLGEKQQKRKEDAIKIF